MQAEIFQLDKNTCYLFYGNYLVYRLPIDKINKCLESLDRGELYEYPRGSERAVKSMIYGSDDGVEVYCCTFMLDVKFRLFLKKDSFNSNVLILLGNGHKGLAYSDTLPYNAKEACQNLMEWLTERLEARGFKAEKRQIPKKYFWWTWALFLFTFLSYVSMFLYATPKKGMVIVATVAIIGFLIISMAITYGLSTIGFKETIYIKKT